MMGRTISLLLMLACALAWGAAERERETAINFSRDILPILSDNCFQCHGPDEKARKAKLRLDTKEGALRVKDDIAVIVPGKSRESELYRRITTDDPDDHMPPAKSNRKLTPQHIQLLKRWIDEGARWGEHWAFEKLSQPEPPEVRQFARRTVNPIDNFVFARLERERLVPSPNAPKETLIRRVTLDLTGLPATPNEVDDFLKDKSPSAYDKVVQRLLKSPAFGERMAWDWLDAARYADSNGYQGDAERTMWPWRDWVVEAFNRNLPYDQFTLWQLAGDLLPNATLEQKLATGFSRNHMINGEGGRIAEENRVEYAMDMTETMATAWLGLTVNCCRCHDHKFDPLPQRDYYSLLAFFNQTPVDGSSGDPQTKPNLELATEEQKARLAKLDQEIKKSAEELDKFESDFFLPPEEKPASESESAAKVSEEIKGILKTAAAKRNKDQLAKLETEWEKSAPDYAKKLKPLRQAMESRDKLNKSIVRVMIMEDMVKVRETYILEKGIYDKRGETVTAAVPSKLPSLPSGAPTNRLGLAQWLVAPENPLTARVTVNRFWQQFFGVGLVRTVEDFGVQGEKPTHAELLDWLASEFARSGWDVKKLCRLIVTSATYRQSSKLRPELAQNDPQNRLLARGPRFRMPSWMIRDQALAASGLLVNKIGGPPVKPYQPSGVWEDVSFGKKRYVQDKGQSLYRRSLYTFWRRIIGPTMFFDTAARQVCTVKQPRTNVPLHALATLNDTTYVEAARALAERVLTTTNRPHPSLSHRTRRAVAPSQRVGKGGRRPGEGYFGDLDAERIELAFRLVLSRKPTAKEKPVLLDSLKRLRHEFMANPDAAKKFLAVGESKRNEKLDAIEHAAYAGLCATILNLDEALTKE